MRAVSNVHYQYRIFSRTATRIISSQCSFQLPLQLQHSSFPCRSLHVSPKMAATTAGAMTAGKLERPCGSLAYVHTPGNSPGVMFCCGYGSDMSGTKATALEDYCRRKNRSYIRFDYTGCGKSDGDFHTSTLGQWKEDSLAVLDKIAQGPQIIVGSSMGGWLMLLLGEERPDRVQALVGVAAAPDFTRWRVYPDQVEEELKTKGVAYYETAYGTMSISRTFKDETQNHWLLNKTSLNINCPVRLLHGMKDDSVPYNISLQVADKVVSEDVEVILRKSGDHRLSTPEDILLLTQTLDKLIS